MLITGKGRCNITSSLDITDFIKNIPGNGNFLYSAFNKFNNKDIIELLKQNGLETKIERGNRIFPITDKAEDVLKAIQKELTKLKVNIKTNCKIKEVIIDKENKVLGIKSEENVEIYADKVILATGGKSYPVTGSTGDGYKMAEKVGHSITDLKPSLVPLEIYEKSKVMNIQGLSLKNVEIKIKDIKNEKIIYEDFGEMLFTHFGVSGPIILSSSAHLLRYNNIDKLLNEKYIKLIIDLKPALSLRELDLRIRRDFEEIKNKEFLNSLNKLLPRKIIEEFVKTTKINPQKRVNEITKEERQNIAKLLKSFELTIKKFRPIEEAIVTSGGISIKEINPKTMESKIIKGLFFAGEIIDVDAYTGGFNLQIAYSTGYTAGDDK